MVDFDEPTGWEFVRYDNGDSGCEKCGRFRVELCDNGKRRCEKCRWSPELQRKVPDEEALGY